MYIYTEENSVVNRGSYCSFILLQLMEAMPTTNKENYTSTTITRQRLHHTSHAPDIRIPSGASIAAQGTRLRAYHVSFSHIHNNSYTVHIHHFSSFCSLFLLFHPAGSEHSDRYLCDGLVDLRCHACQHSHHLRFVYRTTGSYHTHTSSSAFHALCHYHWQQQTCVNER